MKRQSYWRSFIADLGDTIGGIGIGIITQNYNTSILVFSILILIVAFVFKIPIKSSGKSLYVDAINNLDETELLILKRLLQIES